MYGYINLVPLKYNPYRLLIIYFYFGKNDFEVHTLFKHTKSAHIIEIGTTKSPESEKSHHTLINALSVSLTDSPCICMS